MSFKDTVTKMGYEILEKTKDNIILKKEDEDGIATTLIYFDNTTKTLSGVIKTEKLLCTIGEIAHQYKIFREMRKDLNTFNQLSNYDILN